MTTAHEFTKWWVEHAGVHPAATDPMFTLTRLAWSAGERGHTPVLSMLQGSVKPLEYLLLCEAYDAGRKSVRKSYPVYVG